MTVWWGKTFKSKAIFHREFKRHCSVSPLPLHFRFAAESLMLFDFPFFSSTSCFLFLKSLRVFSFFISQGSKILSWCAMLCVIHCTVYEINPSHLEIFVLWFWKLSYISSVIFSPLSSLLFHPWTIIWDVGPSILIL